MPLGGHRPTRLILLPELVPPPSSGRVFRASRRVRLADVDPAGRARLDSAARWLQDVARDDARDADLDGVDFWVVRRTTIVVEHAPRFDEEVALATFCGGVGARWAERRTSISGGRGGAVEAASLWVCLDPETQRPARLSQQFHDTWGGAAAGRRVSARLRLEAPPSDEELGDRPWPLRHADLDVLGHVNNAAAWSAVDDELARRLPQLSSAGGGLVAELEHASEIPAGADVRLLSAATADTLRCWLASDAGVHVSALVAPAPSA